MPGADRILAITMICYLPELGTLRHKEISSLSGVAPFNRDSGFSKGKRCIQGGIVVSKMNDKFSLRDYPLKAASLYVSALSFILENTIAYYLALPLFFFYYTYFVVKAGYFQATCYQYCNN